MSNRKVAEFRDTTNGAVSKVYYNPEYKEYTVRFYNSAGVWMDGADYFTDDKEDALNTAGIEHPDIVRVS